MKTFIDAVNGTKCTVMTKILTKVAEKLKVIDTGSCFTFSDNNVEFSIPKADILDYYSTSGFYRLEVKGEGIISFFPHSRINT